MEYYRGEVKINIKSLEHRHLCARPIFLWYNVFTYESLAFSQISFYIHHPHMSLGGYLMILYVGSTKC